MLEKLNRLNYLFDFYAALLTKKQQNVMELYYKENFTLAEVAEQFKISRQAVHDILTRAVHALENWEKKLNLYGSYLQRKENGQKALELLAQKHINETEIARLREIVHNMMES